MSALQFDSKLSRPGLSGHFISFDNSNYFAVLNNANTVIGHLVGDGVQVTFSSTSLLGEVQLCMSKRTLPQVTSDSSFTVWDFAESNENFTSLTPLELNVIQEAIEGGNNTLLCANLTLHPSGIQNYFPIIRAPNWQTRSLNDDPAIR